MKETLYRLHGIGLSFTTDSQAIASATEALLRYFRQETPDRSMAIECLFKGVRDRTEIPVAISRDAQPVFSRNGQAAGDLLRTEWKCDLYRDHERLLVDFHEQGLLVLEPHRDRIHGYLIEPDAMHPDVISSFILFALTEVLKGLGVYTIHAAALEKGGRGVLIPGFSGKGKTTCCLALLRAGYRYLSDDHPFIRESGANVELLSFPVKIDVTDKTIEFFPELRAAAESLHEGVRKRYFYVEDLYSQRPADCCKPALMIFPHVIDWPKSYLEPVSKSYALEHLLPQALLVFDKEVCRREFEVLSRLVEQVSCYRLYFGEDLLDLPRLIDPFLKSGTV